MYLRTKRQFIYSCQLIAIALIYFVTGKLGLQIDAVGGFAASVWVPTGLALFGLFTYGTPLWPGVFLGAFSLNYSIGAPVLSALGMATGNTLEALLGAFALRYIFQFNPQFLRLHDVFALIVSAAVCTAISATFGVVSGWLGGVIANGEFQHAWRTWWIGDVLSSLVIAPFLFTLVFTSKKVPPISKQVEALTLFLSLVMIGYLSFVGLGIHELSYLIFPPLIWAAVRFSPKEVSAGVFLISVIAIYGTSIGQGPFFKSTISESLVALQLFMGVSAITSLFLAAAVAERRIIEAALSHSESTLKGLLHDKELLLQEIHHRVKNNLQMISSLITLQTNNTQDAQVQEFFQVTKGRVRSMALIHEQLYRSSNLSQIEMGPYIKSLADEIASLYRKPTSNISMRIDVGELTLSLEQAIPCGLALQELISNAYKHGFREQPSGTITVSLAGNPNLVEIQVRDTGSGVSPDLDVRQVKSLGLKIVNNLAGQLHGVVTVLRDNGTLATLSFPNRPKAERRTSHSVST